MSNFFECTLTEIEKNKFSAVFDTKTRNENSCIVWTGQQKKGYGIFETRFRGKKIKIAAHRLSYFVANNFQRILVLRIKIFHRYECLVPNFFGHEQNLQLIEILMKNKKSCTYCGKYNLSTNFDN